MEDHSMFDAFELTSENHPSGIVFHLNEKVQLPHVNSYTRRIGIWHITVKDKKDVIVARSRRTIKRTNIFESAYNAIQMFLDILTLEKRTYHEIKNKTSHILWYKMDGKIIFEDVSRSVLNVTSRTQVKKVPVDKRKKPTIVEGKVSTHHPAMRYFRLSRTSDDFIDSFRNQYLTFEQLLSSKSPRRKKPRETERAWIKRVLSTVSKKRDLKKILQPNNQSIEDAFLDKVYSVRLSLFHSKNDEGYLLPCDLISDKKIIDTLRKLELINWTLFDEHFDTTFSRGGVVLGGMRMIAKSFSDKEKQFKILLSDEHGGLSPKSTLIDEENRNHVETKASFLLEDTSNHVFAEYHPSKLANISFSVRRVVVAGSDGAYAFYQRDDVLRVGKEVDTYIVRHYLDVTSSDFHKYFS